MKKARLTAGFFQVDPEKRFGHDGFTNPRSKPASRPFVLKRMGLTRDAENAVKNLGDLG